MKNFVLICIIVLAGTFAARRTMSFLQADNSASDRASAVATKPRPAPPPTASSVTAAPAPRPAARPTAPQPASAALLTVDAAAADVVLAAPPRIVNPVPRVAMLNMTSDDGYYRGATVMADLTAATQGLLADVPGIEWIERQELQTASDELQLSALGASEREGLRLGRWLGADLLLTGRMTSTGPESRVLRLAVVDMFRAEVLAQQDLPFTGDTREPPHVSMEDADRVAKAARELLLEGRQNLLDAEPRRVIAPLFVKNITGTPRLNYAETRIIDEIATTASQTNDARVIRLTAAGEASSEAELAVVGLTDIEPLAFQQVADIYVWGVYQELDNGQASRKFDDVPVELTLHVWNGGAQTQSFTATTTVKQIDAAARQLAARILAVPKAETMTAGMRDEAAQRLLLRAREIRSRGEQTPHAQSLHRYKTRLLETASFFAPEAVEIRRELLLARYQYWSHRLEVSRQLRGMEEALSYLGLLQPAAASREQVAPALEIIDGLYESVLKALRTRHRIGIDRAAPPDLPIAEARRMEAIAVELRIKSLPWRQHEKRPMFTPDLELLDPALQRKIVEAFWPERDDAAGNRQMDREKIGLALTRIYGLEGLGRVIEMLSLPKPEAPAAPAVPARPVAAAGDYLHRYRDEQGNLVAKSPVSRAVSPHAPQIRSAPPISDSPACPVLTPRSRGVAIAGRPGPSMAVPLMTYSAGKLWLGLADTASNAWHGFGSSASTLHTYDPAANEFTEFTPKLGQVGSISDLMVDGDHLWLTSEAEGVYRITLADLAIRKFSGADGLLSNQMRHVARLKDRLLFAGDAPRLNTLDPAAMKWGDLAVTSPDPKTPIAPRQAHGLVGFDRWAIARAVPSLLIDGVSGGAKVVSEEIGARLGTAEPATPVTTWGAMDDTQRRGYLWNPVAVTADSSGFWLLCRHDLVRWNPGTGDIQRWPLPVAGHWRQLLIVGDQLWLGGVEKMPDVPDAGGPQWRRRPPGMPPTIAQRHQMRQMEMSQRSRIVIFDGGQRKWRGAFEIEGELLSMAATPRDVWIGRRAVPHQLLEIDRASVGAGPTAAEIASLAELQSNTPARGLWCASYWGQAERVKQMLSAGASPNAGEDQGWTPLLAAIRGGDAAMVNTLLEAGAKAAQTRQSSTEPLHPLVAAVEQQSAEMVASLLRHHVTLHEPPHDFGAMAIERAAEQADVQIITLLLQAGANVNPVRHQVHYPPHKRVPRLPILHAIEREDEAVLKALISGGARLDLLDPVFGTPLYFAAASGSEPMVQLMLAHGAPVDGEFEGRTALTAAAEKGHLAVVRRLLAAGVNLNRHGAQALIAAVEGGHVQMVKLLLDSGVGVATTPVESTHTIINEEFRYASGSAVSAAAAAGHLDILELLAERVPLNTPWSTGTLGGQALFFNDDPIRTASAIWLVQHGVNVNETDLNGMTPLMWAAKYSRHDVVQLLLEHSADPAIRAADGRTALGFATDAQIKAMLQGRSTFAASSYAMPDDAGVRKLLVVRAAFENRPDELAAVLATGVSAGEARTPDDWPALLLAARRGHIQIVEQMLAAGCDPNLRGPGGWTALMQAASRGDVQVVELLLQRGADPTLRNEFDQDALDIAAAHGHEPVVLRLHGGKPVDQRGQMLIAAAQRGNPAALDLMLSQGAPADETDAAGRTALFYAVQAVMPDAALPMVRQLLAAGANVNHQDITGRTPLSVLLATQQVWPSVAKALIDGGARTDLPDNEGRTALDLLADLTNRVMREQLAAILEKSSPAVTARPNAQQLAALRKANALAPRLDQNPTATAQLQELVRSAREAFVEVRAPQVKPMVHHRIDLAVAADGNTVPWTPITLNRYGTGFDAIRFTAPPTGRWNMNWEFMCPEDQLGSFFIVGPQAHPVRFSFFNSDPPEQYDVPRDVSYISQQLDGQGQVLGGQEYILWFDVNGTGPMSLLVRIGLTPTDENQETSR